MNHDGQDGNGQEVSEKQYGFGVHAVLVQRQCEQRVHAVSGGGDGSQDVAFGLLVHILSLVRRKCSKVILYLDNSN